MALMLTTASWAAEQVFHRFGAYAKNPAAGPLFDAAGDLYGTTQFGGPNNVGTVWEYGPTPVGVYTTLYEFKGGSDGANPVASLIWDNSGNLYGTTKFGGQFGRGTVFELSRQQSGPWTETILYSFGSQQGDGSRPSANLVFDSQGNLYSTTLGGGSTGNFVTVFELTPGSSGWTESVLYSFRGGNDGAIPASSLVLDSAGNLYGTTVVGGAGTGTVFELSPSGGGWVERVIHAFQPSGSGDGSGPTAGVIFDSNGNLYGTTEWGGVEGNGIVFKLAPVQGGWTESIIHRCKPAEGDGAKPRAALTFDHYGVNLYGTTSLGGAYNYGTVFEFSPKSDGNWQETAHHSFTGGSDGAYPYGAVILDGSSDVYGTTFNGGIAQGSAGNGVVFWLF